MHRNCRHRPRVQLVAWSVAASRDRAWHRLARTAPRGARHGLAALLLAGAAIAGGCAPAIGVNRIGPQEANRALAANVLNTGAPSAHATQFLYRLKLTEEFAKQPGTALARIHAGLGGSDETARLFALAELSFAYGERGGGAPHYLAAAAYAWAFLFPEPPATPPDCYDPRVRTAMDLYNRGIALGLAGAAPNEVDLGERSVALPFAALRIGADATGFRYGGYTLARFTSLASLEVRGLRNRYRQRGIGAPLAAAVTRTGDEQTDRWIPPQAKIPVTALLRFDDPRAAMAGGDLDAVIELYDTEESGAATIHGVTVPFESDTTANLAFRLEGSPLWDFEIAGFRRGDLTLSGVAATDEDQLFMLHPYHPGRIPIVFVHGTASSPARWAEMTNEIMNDGVLGSRYQYWFFIYNTGNPVAYSAMRLRESLVAALHDVDPGAADPALQQMVVIGHSQGGLLTKMTAVHSGTRFWDAISRVPIEQAGLDPQSHELIRRGLFLEPLPFVRRLIFISTPHRGSFRADSIFGGLARRLVSLPGRITNLGTDLLRLQAAGALTQNFVIPTSIDNMKESNPFLQTLVSLPIAPGVHAHSIIPVAGGGPFEDGNDGIVRYRSAHIDGVDSELVVRSGHSTQATPETIEEVRRILALHLAEE